VNDGRFLAGFLIHDCKACWAHYIALEKLTASPNAGPGHARLLPPDLRRPGKVNGGLVYNMSEDGLALSAAMILGGDELVSMRILLPDSGGWMEATGQLTWRSESRKTAGIRFVGLPEEARQRIADWLAAEGSEREPQPEAEILPRPQQHPAGDSPTRTQCCRWRIL